MSGEEGMLLYVGGGAALGYFAAPGLVGGVTPIMGGALGAGLGYVVHKYMSNGSNKK